jgi:hypothetical protein
MKGMLKADDSASTRGNPCYLNGVFNGFSPAIGEK